MISAEVKKIRDETGSELKRSLYGRVSGMKEVLETGTGMERGGVAELVKTKGLYVEKSRERDGE